MNVHERDHFRVHLASATCEDLPDREAWLTPAERAVAAGLRVPKRRADWILGRWAAKRAIRAFLERLGRPVDFADVEVLPGLGGAPVVTVLGRQDHRVPTVSLSHSHGVGFAAAGRHMLGIGCDLERIEARSGRFLLDYLVEEERVWVGAASPDRRPLAANLCWSAKESALKALHEGLRMDTRAVVVESPALDEAPPGAWSALRVRGPERNFQGWWAVADDFVWTVLTDGHAILTPPEEARDDVRSRPATARTT